MALYLNQIKTCVQYVFFGSVWATAAKQSVALAGFK
jgi:thiamine monophosphate synthase